MKGKNLAEGLALFLQQNPDLAPGDECVPEESSSQETKPKKSPLHVFIEKKGRGGKTATIIDCFADYNSEEVAQLAADIKKHLGTGGSWRDNEILIQGDKRQAVINYLKSKGYNTKG